MEGLPGEGVWANAIATASAMDWIAIAVVREDRLAPRMKLVKCIMRVLVGVGIIALILSL